MAPRSRPALAPSAAVPPPMPDRPLDPVGELPAVAIRAAGNHPFVYRKMVIGPVGGARASDGDLVRVVDRDHLPIGFGLWNGRSQISLRLLAQGLDPIGREFWERRLEQAVVLRREVLG